MKLTSIIGILFTTLALAQTQPLGLKFEVASIKPNKTDERRDYQLRNNELFGKNLSAKAWLQIAYEIKEFQLAGQAWISTEKFDIDARSETPSSIRQKLLMLQSLLADRFKVTLHRETRELQVYDLVIGNRGLKMKQSRDQTLYSGDFPDGPPEGRPTAGGGPSELGPGRLIGDAVPMTIIVNLLAGPLGRQVINKTGLTGRYDIDLRYTPDSGQATFADPDRSPPADPSTASLFTAIQEQLGLRLEPAKGPVAVLVVDHIERPSEN